MAGHSSSFIGIASADLWENIESYLPLEDTVSVAQTCKSFHQLIIDPTTRQVKVSHLTAIRSHRLLPIAMNRIHFPSLRRVHYPPEWRYSNRERQIKQAIISAFPTFVTNLSYASNLQCLKLGQLDHIARAEHQREDISELFNTFSRNMKRTCTKLDDLEVDFSGTVEIEAGSVFSFSNDTEYHSFYSVQLMRVIGSIILKRKRKLERLKISIRGAPAFEFRRYQDVVKEFFHAVLSVRRKLKFLDIDIHDPSSEFDPTGTLNFLPIVAGEQLKADSDIHRPQLEHLGLYLKMTYDHRHMSSPYYRPKEVSPIVPLLENFSNCPSIQSIGGPLNVPREFWGERKSFGALTKLVKKSNLRQLHLDLIDDRDVFSDDFDQGDKLMLSLIDFVMYCKNNNSCIEEVQLSNLMNIKATHLLQLIRILESIGLQLSRASCAVKATGAIDPEDRGVWFNRFPDTFRAERSFKESEAITELERCTEDDRLMVNHLLFRTIGAQERWEKEFEFKKRYKFYEEDTDGDDS